MQRGTWILAISGMMALCQSGSAADPAFDQPSGQTSIGTARVSGAGTANRSAKKPNGTGPAAKNYYKDLFGEDDPASTPAATRKVPASAPARATKNDWIDDADADAPVKPTKAAAKTIDFGAPVDEPSWDGQRTSMNKKPAGAGEKVKVGTRVTQAIYDRNPGRKTPVQQIRNDGRPRSAPPISGFDDSAEKPAHPATGKETKETKEANSRDPFADDLDSPIRVTSERSVAQAGPQTPQVTVEWFKRGEFNVGQECLVDLIVKNAGELPVTQVAVDAIFPTNVRLTAAEPQPASATDRLTWTFENLAPASEKKITIKLIPSRRGEVGATAQVRFTGASSAAFAVSEPLLKVTLKPPSKEIMLGDPASQMITVTNPGTGTAQDVKIEAKLSDGLEHSTREDRLVIEVGAVGPGETRTYRLGLTASKGGTQSISVVATSSSDASSTDEIEFDVVAPSLKIAVEGPSLRYKGRNAKYTLTVTNDGSLANNNIHISQAVAEGFKFISADHNGKFDSSVRTINWFAGRLEPGETAQVSCELQSLQIGEFAHTVQVMSETGVQADARIETRVDGIASLTMELVDLDDPVETGSETGYEIRVKNDGSKTASGVIVTCDLPAGMELLSAKAPVDQVTEGRQLSFEPIEQIAPGGQVTIRIHMKVIRDGSHRLRVKLTGGGLQEPMCLEEVTRAYSDGSN